jgi:hypothetical protein
MTTQKQDQPTAASEPVESGKARTAARKPTPATARGESARKPSRVSAVLKIMVGQTAELRKRTRRDEGRCLGSVTSLRGDYR